jgi:microcystin-dependent protein
MAWDVSKPSIDNILNSDITAIRNNFAAVQVVLGATRLNNGTLITDDAADVEYDNTTSEMVADNVQDAIDELAQGVPRGCVQLFAMNTAPTGWFECDGSAKSRTTYDKLFATIGTVFGTGDGVTTFNIPDLRGMFVRGWDNGAGVDTGRAFGSDQDDAMEQHSHYTGNAMQSGERAGYAAAGYTTANNLSATRRVNGQETAPVNNAITSGVISSGAAFAGGQEGATTSCKAASTETRPINTALMYCIKY